MNIGNKGHLTYCTNIHPGESWVAVFSNLEQYCLAIKKNISPGKPFGIGLRLSNMSSEELLAGEHLRAFKIWLAENDLYIFTINGFPYGNFHHQSVKDNVHTPDWTTKERVDYTKRLFCILAALLPNDMDGGISTSPISYKYWHTLSGKLETIKKTAVENLINVVAFLVRTRHATGKKMHLDIEPEPDGILETIDEYIAFFEKDLLVDGALILAASLSCSLTDAQDHIRCHIQLCYDICHFAVEYETAGDVIKKMAKAGLRIGKIQISAALKCRAIAISEIPQLQACLQLFDESTYLHQAVVKTTEDQLLKFRDLGPGIQAMARPGFKELRTHFHVPIFTAQYRQLEATQSDIRDALQLWCIQPFTAHLEVETYTWDVLPPELQMGLKESIERELLWVMQQIEKGTSKTLV